MTATPASGAFRSPAWRTDAHPSPKPAAKPTAPATRGGASTAPKPATPSAAPVTEGSGELAATGPSNARWLGALGGALLLLGGLGLMTPAARRQTI